MSDIISETQCPFCGGNNLCASVAFKDASKLSDSSVPNAYEIGNSEIADSQINSPEIISSEQNEVAEKKISCWCMTEKVPDELIALATSLLANTTLVNKAVTNKPSPEENDIKSCICQLCISRYKQSPDQFLEQFSK